MKIKLRMWKWSYSGNFVIKKKRNSPGVSNDEEVVERQRHIAQFVFQQNILTTPAPAPVRFQRDESESNQSSAGLRPLALLDSTFLVIQPPGSRVWSLLIHIFIFGQIWLPAMLSGLVGEKIPTGADCAGDCGGGGFL